MRYTEFMRQKDFQNFDSNKKLDEIFKSVERTRNYFKWTLIVSVAVIVLPLLGLLFIIPQFLSSYNLSSFGL